MFAYCGNNPVNLVDSSGKYPVLFDENPYDEAIRKFGQWLGGLLKEDVDRLNDSEKTEEEKALECNFFSVYKDVLVIRAPIGRTAGSFGFIVLGEKIESTSAGESLKTRIWALLALTGYRNCALRDGGCNPIGDRCCNKPVRFIKL